MSSTTTTGARGLSFTVAVEPDGAQVAAMLLGLTLELERNMGQAMTDIVLEVVPSVGDHMHWQNPTGDLELSFYDGSGSQGNWKAVIGSALPYARRRERGFSGMTDSLGRYYAHDPGAFYLEDTLTDESAWIEQRISQAVSQTLNRLGIP